MIIAEKVRRGEGPVWRAVKHGARRVLGLHVPVVPVMRPLFRSLYPLHVSLREFLVWARRFFWYEPLFRSQCESVGEGFWMEQLPYLAGRERCGFDRLMAEHGFTPYQNAPHTVVAVKDNRS